MSMAGGRRGNDKTCAGDSNGVIPAGSIAGHRNCAHVTDCLGRSESDSDIAAGSGSDSESGRGTAETDRVIDCCYGKQSITDIGHVKVTGTGLAYGDVAKVKS